MTPTMTKVIAVGQVTWKWRLIFISTGLIIT